MFEIGKSGLLFLSKYNLARLYLDKKFKKFSSALLGKILPL